MVLDKATRPTKSDVAYVCVSRLVGVCRRCETRGEIIHSAAVANGSTSVWRSRHVTKVTRTCVTVKESTKRTDLDDIDCMEWPMRT